MGEPEKSAITTKKANGISGHRSIDTEWAQRRRWRLQRLSAPLPSSPPTILMEHEILVSKNIHLIRLEIERMRKNGVKEKWRFRCVKNWWVGADWCFAAPPTYARKYRTRLTYVVSCVPISQSTAATHRHTRNPLKMHLFASITTKSHFDHSQRRQNICFR